MTKAGERQLGEMLVSAAKGRIVQVDASKVAAGSFFTTDEAWLNAPVRQFLAKVFENNPKVLDPFAGDGHLLELLAREFGVSTAGFDIQGDRWPVNDSLLDIPNQKQAVIVTNPPYLANHSARRKGVHSLAAAYFTEGRDNLYKVALDRCLEAADYVVAIIPETFLLSGYPTDRLVLATVIEAEIFDDTDAPALVACFGPVRGKAPQRVFLDDQPVATVAELNKLRLPGEEQKRNESHEIHFNDPRGRIGLRAVDGTKPEEQIRFMLGKQFDYPRSSIKVSSRLMTYIEIPELSDEQLPAVIDSANRLLDELRRASQNLVLAPFKGNNKAGRRRRRLDYELARHILVHVLNESA